jgi:hypothetical protein
MSDYGYFVGEVVTKWLKNEGKDRDMVLLNEFSYVDPVNKEWKANPHDVVNGASIPAFLWGRLLGSPFVGDYRRATVLHDVACDTETEPSSAVHRMFYYAMLCDGVRKAKAYLIYKAVDWFGPDWGAERQTKSALQAHTVENLDRFEEAVERTLEELGPDAPLEELDARVEQLLNQE